MDKLEAIKNVYGEHWEKVKDYVDENGWISLNSLLHIKLNPNKFVPLEIDDEFTTTYRPKSLSGIESNNGWISILSKEDIKNFQNEFCWVYFKSGELEKIYIHSSNHKFLLNNCTHYQPIIKPQPPIY